MDKCDLFIPHKNWSDDPREAENYAAMERWSTRLRTIYGGTAVHALFTRAAFTGNITVPDDTVTVFVYADFSTLTRNNQIGDQTQLTSGVTSGITGLQINHSGLFSWIGWIQFFHAANYFHVEEHVDDFTFPTFGGSAFHTEVSVGGGIIYPPLGGSAYVKSGSIFSVQLRQSSGGPVTVIFNVAVTLLQL